MCYKGDFPWWLCMFVYFPPSSLSNFIQNSDCLSVCQEQSFACVWFCFTFLCSCCRLHLILYLPRRWQCPIQTVWWAMSHWDKTRDSRLSLRFLLLSLAETQIHIQCNTLNNHFRALLFVIELALLVEVNFNSKCEWRTDCFDACYRVI